MSLPNNLLSRAQALEALATSVRRLHEISTEVENQRSNRDPTAVQHRVERMLSIVTEVYERFEAAINLLPTFQRELMLAKIMLNNSRFAGDVV